MRQVMLAFMAAALTAGFTTPSTVQADGNIVVHRSGSVLFGNPVGGADRWAWGPFSLNRSLGYIPTPPYYALHPPVHYSHHISVPYGMSPYPIISYSPMFRTVQERSTPQPQVVVNPYVQDEPAPQASPPFEQPTETLPEQDVTKIIDAQGESLTPATQPAVIENTL